MKRFAITLLGSTGSIGINTLNVIASNTDRYDVYALTANNNIDLMFLQCLQYRPNYAVMVNEKAANELSQRLREKKCKTEVLSGENALIDIAKHPSSEVVLAAIVGAAGLLPTMAAVKAGKRVLLANKESLIMSGELLINAVRDYDATLIPVDSEHNALLQCMPAGYLPTQEKPKDVQSIILTASGGPFRSTPLPQLSSVTVKQALAHPNWKMGNKITIDSATMINKGLEVAEACWLFGLSLQQIEVLIHPQSIIHSMVRYCDGSILAQMGLPDMRTPIAVALAWPDRIHSEVGSVDFLSYSRLDFEAVCFQRYPCLKIVYQAMEAGGTSMAILNAANEVAVNSFLEQHIGFTQISSIIEETLQKIPNQSANHLKTVLEADAKARQFAKDLTLSICN